MLILGHGYVGGALASRLPHAIFTSSSPEKATSNAGIYFNLSDRGSWKNLPAANTVIWTFAATPLKLVEEFYQSRLKNCKNLLVYASSSCYLLSGDNNLVTEQHPLCYAKPRVAGEEYLRKHNAAIFVLSGIYGPQREPINWLRKGLIHSFEKTVNLIHRDDIVEITHYLLDNNLVPYGERLNITNGDYMRWSDIAKHYGFPSNSTNNTNDSNSKLVSNDKLCQLLPDNFEFRILF